MMGVDDDYGRAGVQYVFGHLDRGRAITMTAISSSRQGYRIDGSDMQLATAGRM